MKLLIILLLGTFMAHAEIKITGEKIEILNDPNFESKLETKSFGQLAKEATLRETGFIVASAQSTYENDRFTNKWVGLDDQTLKANSISLSGITPTKGAAYGVIATSESFAPEIRLGQEVVISRYGLTGDRFKGKILKIIKKDDQDIIQVHFVVPNAQELIAGTTCEVEISHIKVAPFKVSLLSLLHIGLEDYIVIKETDGVYYPKHVTIIDQTDDEATVLVPVAPNLKYVARGAILLKPLLNRIVKPIKVQKR